MSEHTEELGGLSVPIPPGFDVMVRQAQAGDRGAMDRVLCILRPYLECLARSYSDSSQKAVSTADLLQDACLRAWENLSSFRGGKNDEETFRMFRAWIGKLVRRLGLNSWRDSRRLRRRPSVPIVPLGSVISRDSAGRPQTAEALAADPTPSDSARSEELAEKVRAAVDALPDETDAAIMRLRGLQGLKIEEVCGLLGLGYDEVRNRYRAILKELQWKLRSYYES